MTMNYETQESWVNQWQEDQLERLIQETKQYLQNSMLSDEICEETTEEKPIY